MLPAALEGADWRIPAPGRVRDLSRIQPEEGNEAPAPAVVRRHYLAKFSAPLSRELVSRLARSGLVLQTRLSEDSGVLYAAEASPAGSPDVAWFAPLEPEDKAPASLFSGDRVGAVVSVLGHPGTKLAELEEAAARDGLHVLGGHDSSSGARLDLSPGAATAALRALLQSDAVLAALPAAPPRLANDRVGSSASRMRGSPATARATATRCC